MALGQRQVAGRQGQRQGVAHSVRRRSAAAVPAGQLFQLQPQVLEDRPGGKPVFKSGGVQAAAWIVEYSMNMLRVTPWLIYAFAVTDDFPGISLPHLQLRNVPAARALYRAGTSPTPAPISFISGACESTLNKPSMSRFVRATQALDHAHEQAVEEQRIPLARR